MHNTEMIWCCAVLTLTLLTLLTNAGQRLQAVYRTPPDRHDRHASGSFVPPQSPSQHRHKEGKQKQIPVCLPTHLFASKE